YFYFTRIVVLFLLCASNFLLYLSKLKATATITRQKDTANSLLAVSFSIIHYESKSNANARVHNPLSIW
ncbi:hypothetical protein PJO48_29830, partial [Mycobacterium kansasii]